MDKRRRRQSKAKASCSEEVSSIEWEAVKMSEEEEDLISRMYKLVGDRWELIAGRIPGRTPEEIERYWLMKHGVVFANRRREFILSQALLSGCSGGGLASILHCDQFKELLSGTTKVKCLSDAGMFMDALDSGEFPQCFFPQNLVSNIKTPMFLLNAAYDAWQVQESLAPPSVDLSGSWKACKSDHSHCNSTQIQFFQDFRIQMVDAVKSFSASTHNGVFINLCFAHCQSERQDTWFAPDSPCLHGKTVAESVGVGDWI